MIIAYPTSLRASAWRARAVVSGRLDLRLAACIRRYMCLYVCMHVLSNVCVCVCTMMSEVTFVCRKLGHTVITAEFEATLLEHQVDLL